MYQEISQLLIHAGIVQGVFASILIATKKDCPCKSLIPIVICFSVIVSHGYYISNFVDAHIKSPFIVAEPFIFLISPLLFFHFRKITFPDTKFKFSDLIHLLPFLLFFISFIPVNFHGSETSYHSFLYGNPIIITSFLWIFLIFQFLYYWRKLISLNRIFVAKLKEEHSEFHEYDASWIKTFLALFLIIFLFIILILSIFIHEGNFKDFNLIIPSFFSLALYIITFKGLKQRMPNSPESSTDNTNAKQIDESKFADLKVKLQDFMIKEKPFLNPELTLKELAVQFGVSRNQLSYLINNIFNNNFYLFVNEFRVEHVKELMTQDKQKKMKILALAYDAGFNSKSTFNSVFKKTTGLTPSEYRDRLS